MTKTREEWIEHFASEWSCFYYDSKGEDRPLEKLDGWEDCPHQEDPVFVEDVQKVFEDYRNKHPRTSALPQAAARAPISSGDRDPSASIVPKSQPSWSAPGYTPIQKLGEGGFGEVWRAQESLGGGFVALKVVDLQEKRGTNIEHEALNWLLRQEKRIAFPHLIDIWQAWVEPAASDETKAPTRPRWLFVAMELADGTLWDLFLAYRKQGLPGIPRDKLVTYIRQAAEGIDYLNIEDVARGKPAIRHKDISPKNLFLVGGQVKVGDFSLLQVAEQTVTKHAGGGHPYYAPPEFYDPIMQVTATSDQYSLAATYFHLLVGELLPPNGINRLWKVELQDWNALTRALDDNPEKRWPSCQDFVRALGSGVVEAQRFEILINGYTSGFVGRCREIAQVMQWVRGNASGYYLITGDFGVGKSALMSALSRIGSDSVEETFHNQSLVALLHRNAWPNVDVVPYFIKRDHNTAAPGEFLSYLVWRLEHRYDLPSDTLANLKNHPCKLLEERLEEDLQTVSKRLQQSGGKLILLIDGLDESASAEGQIAAGQSLLQSIPQYVPPSVFFVLSGRRHKEVDDLRGRLLEFKPEKVDGMDLEGLSDADMQSLLERGLNQYKLEPAYVEEVIRFSQGNPQILKLLMREVKAGNLPVNEVGRLPTGSVPDKVQWLYKRIVSRLRRRVSDTVLPILMTFALAEELFTAEQVAGITGQPLQTFEECHEMLTPQHNIKGTIVYRISHQTFSDYLRSTHPEYIPEVSQRILVYAVRRGTGQEPDQEVVSVIERLIVGIPLGVADAPVLSHIIRHGAELLTGYNLIFQKLRKRPPEQLELLLAALSHCEGEATAQMAIDCLVSVAQDDPAFAGRIVVKLVERPEPGAGAVVARSNEQAARIALDVAVRTSPLISMAESIRNVLLAACDAPDPNVRLLAIMAVVRFVPANSRLGFAVLEELNQRSVRFRLPQPHKLVVFIGCALGLFLERPHDEQLVQYLRKLAKTSLARAWVRVSLWLMPKVAEVLWTSIPDEFNNVNRGEVVAYKKYAADHPELVEAVNKVIDFIDPSYGTPDQFREAISRHDQLAAKTPEAIPSILAAQHAIISRALAGDDSALEVAYESWRDFPSPEHGARQDFMFRIRIVQVGRKRAHILPLGPLWADRIEEAIKDFMYNHYGAYLGVNQVYTLGAVSQGIVFLANQQQDGRVVLLTDLIESLPCGHDGILQKRPTALLMRLLEAIGVEFGSFDPLAHQAALFGVSCFLSRSAKLDDDLWVRLATVLARMRFYAAGEIDRFIDQLENAEHREKLQTLMNGILPKEGVGVLLCQARLEKLMVSMLAGPGDMGGRMRREWQGFLRILLGPKKLFPTLQYGIKKGLHMIRGDGGKL